MIKREIIYAGLYNGYCFYRHKNSIKRYAKSLAFQQHCF